MKRIDITDEWPVLSVNPNAMHAFVMGQYGADRVEQADWPYSVLYVGRERLGRVDTHGYPRVTQEGDRLFLELADLEEDSE